MLARLPKTVPQSTREASAALRPFVYVNVAISADGKIAPATRRFVPFGSPRDHARLLELRADADAVMAGARTVDLFPVNMGPGGLRYRRRRIKNGLNEYNLRVIVSGSGSIDAGAEIFNHRFSPIIVLTTARAAKPNLRRLVAAGAIVHVGGETEIDFAAALRWLREEWDVHLLLCEGGGELNAALFRADLVDQVHVTWCPLLIGGRAAPTLADGVGVERLTDARMLRLESARRIRDELFLTYRRADSAATYSPTFRRRKQRAAGQDS